MSAKWIPLGLAASALSACATVPDVTATYYLPKATTSVTVIQSVACNKAGDRLFTRNDAKQTTTFAADTARGHPIEFRKLDGAFSDSNTAINFYDDGRLKGVNAATGGKGDEIAKAAITIVSLALPGLKFAAAAPPGKPPKPPTPCEVVAAWGGGDPVTLSYSASIDYAADFAAGPASISKDFAADPGSREFHDLIASQLQPMKLIATKPTPLPKRSAYQPPRLADGKPDTGNVIIVKVTPGATSTLNAQMGGAAFWTGGVSVPASAADDVDLPIPRSALFGKQGFTLALSEAGAVQTLAYSKDTGLGAALTTAGAIGTEAQPKTDAERAAELQAQADLIAQQHRIVACTADPTTCSP